MNFFFHFFFVEKIRLDVSSESSAKQRIHMKNQALFSSKDKSKKLKCRLLPFLIGAVRIKSLLCKPILRITVTMYQLGHFGMECPCSHISV